MTTNYEKIKQMSIDEMARMFYDIAFNDFVCNEKCTAPDNCQGSGLECIYGIREWLEAESEE